MRLKQLWGYLPLPAYAKTFWARITFSRLTVIYLIFSIIHFLVQLALQSKGFAINADAFHAGNAFLRHKGGDATGLPIYIDSTLRICQWIPSNLTLEDGDCHTIWPITENDTTEQADNASLVPTYYADSVSSPPESSTEDPTAATSATLSNSSVVSPVSVTSSSVPPVTSALSTPTSPVEGTGIPTTTVAHTTTATIVVSPKTVNSSGRNGDGGDDDGDDVHHGTDGTTDTSDDNDPLGDVIVQLLQGRATTPIDTIDIDPICLKAWQYPLSILGNTIREDIVFIAFQFWVLGMSVVALLNESIPHIVASLVTHVVATIWGSLQLVHTAHFRAQFGVLIIEGACKGIQSPVTSHYWDSRKDVEIISLAFNALALLVSCILSWRLFKLFGWQTFKRVGACRTINRIYKIVLVLSITIQLSFFFVAVTVSLWLDRLVNYFIGDVVDFRKAYLASCIITLTLLIPWLMMGWFGSRRELRVPMLVFLGLCIVYLGGWGIMFVSTTFRLTFITWDLFSIMAVASVTLTFACFALGIFCRINFNKGLPSHLSSQDEFYAPGDFGIVTPDYGYDDEKIDFPSTEAPMPTFNAAYGNGKHSQGRSFSDGSRSSNQGSPPVVVAFPPHALTRYPSHKSTSSFSSEDSGSSWQTHSQSRSGISGRGRSNRWIIE